MNEPVEIAPDERDGGALDRDARAGAHRDTDVGLRQRRRIVDAVARHRDLVPLSLKSADDLGFLIRQDLGFNTIDTQLLGDRLRRRPIVAREHDQVVDAQPAQLSQRFLAARPGRVGDSNVPLVLRAPLHQHRGLPRGGHFV